jgi:hypothetical protein
VEWLKVKAMNSSPSTEKIIIIIKAKRIKGVAQW